MLETPVIQPCGPPLRRTGAEIIELDTVTEFPDLFDRTRENAIFRVLEENTQVIPNPAGAPYRVDGVLVLLELRVCGEVRPLLD